MRLQVQILSSRPFRYYGTLGSSKFNDNFLNYMPLNRLKINLNLGAYSAKETELTKKLGRWQSGQLRETVNLLTEVYGGSNPSLPTIYKYSSYKMAFM